MSDRQQDTVSATGVWVDLDTGKVVESQPVAGKLIVAPGGIVDQRVLDDIAAAELVAGQTDDEPEPDEKSDDEDKGEETRTSGRGRAKQRATVGDDTDKATE